jgi:hypothetical protein
VFDNHTVTCDHTSKNTTKKKSSERRRGKKR